LPQRQDQQALLAQPMPAKIGQLKIQPIAPAAPFSTGTGTIRDVVFSTRNGSASKASSASFSVEAEQPDRPNVRTRMVVRQVGVFDPSGKSSWTLRKS
jgi:hypothetical protein